MKLDNHIAKRFLTDKSLIQEIVDTQFKGWEGADKSFLTNFLSSEYNKNYYITNPVLDNLDLFDTRKAMQLEGWRVFNHLPDNYKKTFILPNNIVIRIGKVDNAFHCMHMQFTFKPNDKLHGNLAWCLFWQLIHQMLMILFSLEKWPCVDYNILNIQPCTLRPPAISAY